jgi:hypothetical protein
MDQESNSIEMADLGDAASETKQMAPAIAYADNLYGWGRSPGYMEPLS